MLLSLGTLLHAQGALIPGFVWSGSQSVYQTERVRFCAVSKDRRTKDLKSFQRR